MPAILYLVSSVIDGEDNEFFVSAENAVDAVQLWATGQDVSFKILRTEVKFPGRAVRYGDWISVYEVPSVLPLGLKKWADITSTYLEIEIE
jgi:hypothetical protein